MLFQEIVILFTTIIIGSSLKPNQIFDLNLNYLLNFIIIIIIVVVVVVTTIYFWEMKNYFYLNSLENRFNYFIIIII
jgi:hypothetical protein